MSARYDFALQKGNDITRIFRFRSADGALVDLTGSRLTLTIDVGTGRRAQHELAISSPTSGEATLTLAPLDTRELPVGASQYEVERSFEANFPASETTILSGLIIVQRGINDDR